MPSYTKVSKPTDATYTNVLHESWDIGNAILIQAADISTNAANPESIYIRGDGSKMYLLAYPSTWNVVEYDLSTSWDISTASFLQDTDTGLVNGGDAIFFKPDGLKMYIPSSNEDLIYEYDLTTAWDSSTFSELQSYDTSADSTTPNNLFFKSDGLKMYITDDSANKIHEYDLSTAWDVSTASLLQSKSISSQTAWVDGLFIRPNGLNLYITNIVGASNIYQYRLTTAWDVSTLVYEKSLSISSSDVNPYDLFFKPDGINFYVVREENDTVNDYRVTADYTDVAKPTSSVYTKVAKPT